MMAIQFRSSLYLTLIVSVLAVACVNKSDQSKYHNLYGLLGEFPTPPTLQLDTLETVRLDGGVRYTIEYTVENEDTLFDRPVDRVRAYLFVPQHQQDQKLPAIVAIHQDGNRYDLGKSEPAGVDGEAGLAYGLELFNRGYVVICPDRFPHGERRRLEHANQQMPPMMRNISLWMRWTGQLILTGRTYFGKEVYDLMRSVDVLHSFDFVDQERTGAIGHSAGGNVLVYFMFVDPRVRAGVSSCGFFDLIDYFNDRESNFANSAFALPHLARYGKSADYLSAIAPRPFLLTRGLWEHGKATDTQKRLSAEHVNDTKAIEAYVRTEYEKRNASDSFAALYFDGGHAFPVEIRERAYKWLDQHLKPSLLTNK